MVGLAMHGYVYGYVLVLGGFILAGTYRKLEFSSRVITFMVAN